MSGVKTRWIVAALAVVLVLSLVHRAEAFAAGGDRWTLNRTVVMHLSLGGPQLLSDGFNSFNASAADALNRWNSTLVHLRFTSVVGSTLPTADNDYDNSVFFSNTVFGQAFGASTVAVTLISNRGNIRLETDVVFNSNIGWDSYRGPLRTRDDALDFHRVALHEFGHVVGLDHPDQANQTVAAIMNSRVGSIDDLQPDDEAGAGSLYNVGPPYRSSVPSGNLVNLSTRALIGTGENVLIGGFIVQGSSPATVVLRAVGHSLAGQGISNPLADPVMELRNASGALLTQNDDWIDSSDAETIASYRLDPANSLESAILRTLTPGNYTVLVRAFDNGNSNLTGTGLVEIFDLHTTNGRAGNISTRGQVLADNDIMIAGFIVGGSQSKETVVRGLGPSLASAGIRNALADPTIELVDRFGTLLASNDNWATGPGAGRITAVGLAPTNSAEAAINAVLGPGPYTVLLRGKNRGTGIGLVEVYDLSAAPN